MSQLVKKSFSLNGHRTSIALENAFWARLQKMAGERTLASIIVKFDTERDQNQSLASTLRLAVLKHLEAQLASCNAAEGDAS